MFAKRVLTAAILLPVFAGALLFLPQIAWALFLLPGLAIASVEWADLAQMGPRARYAYGALISLSAPAVLYLVPLSHFEAWPYRVSVCFWVLIAPLWLSRHWSVRNTFVRALVGWIVLVPMWLALVQLQTTPWTLLLILSIVWVADTAAYAVGRCWGRRKLAPTISPGKSWEGVLGAVAAIGLYYGVLWLTAPAGSRLVDAQYGLLIFVAVLVLSIVGDLFESLMKRQAGVKDSGQLLPGHGGVLDRIDGLTSTLPFAALVLYYM
jgi:phosphatidate cytidylyltransferase